MVSTPEHTAVLAVDSRCTHGEGVLWCEQREALYWVDISESACGGIIRTAATPGTGRCRTAPAAWD